jgi:hypothetical protein
MKNLTENASAAQIEAASLIERDTARLKELAIRHELRFIAYLIDMAREEAGAVAKRKRVQSAGAAAAS